MNATHTLVIALLAAGCATDPAPMGAKADATLAESAWAGQDSPDLLDDNMNHNLAALPLSGAAAESPWAGTYWPTYKDNINDPWAGAGTQPPSTKYAAAFGRTGLEDRVSAEFGIDSRSTATPCTTTDECNDELGEACAIRTGETAGKCVPTWFGICHAWAPAAIMEREPQHAVTHNGVEFKVNDLKALISLSYGEGLDVKFMSLRCNENLSDDGQVVDNTPVADECQDSNAGAFHIAIANIVGLQSDSLVEDRTIDAEVWNQPIRAYDVYTNQSLTAAQAQTYAGGTGSTYTFNSAATQFRRVQMRLDYISEPAQNIDGNLASVIDTYTHSDHYEYVLELDASGDIVGGEWIGASRIDHPDFLWRPTVKHERELAKDGGQAGTGIKWSDVKMLLELSIDDGDEGGNGGFDWGGTCESGSGDFNQDISHQATVDVGQIPVDKANVRIELASSADVDIQLIDEATGTEIIAWPNGLLSDSGEGCTTWNGVEYCYSGYNGDGTNLGNEWIEVRGVTNRSLMMKAYGYAAGNALVTYTWDAPDDCVDAGTGSFDQAISKGESVDVGTIPPGKSDIRIELTADNDVDIQLYEGTHPIVEWPNGMLANAGAETVTWNGLTIAWSGYNGTDDNKGHEYITISGTVSDTLTMKAFGYEEGQATVSYGWGLDDLSTL